MDEPEEEEPSLDRLSQAFAEAMGREQPKQTVDAAREQESAPITKEANSSPPAPLPADLSAISPRSILEAILFVGHPENQPITKQGVASLLRGVDEAEVGDLIEDLNAEYVTEDMPFLIVANGAGYRLELKSEFHAIRDKFYGNVREARLSQQAVDVLATVAYNQPITRADVEKLIQDSRPIQRLLNQLVRRDLLIRRPVEGSPGKHEYATSERFLDLFDLRDLGDLPRPEEAS